MKHIQILTLSFALFITLGLKAQVGINVDGSAPDSSAMLDVKSIDKGMLVPRMTTAQRTTISNPATGLLVFDNETGSFWFYTGSVWTELVSGNLTTLSDEDGDTKIQVEESADEDIIRFDLGGTEHFVMDGPRLEVLNSGSSVFIGQGAGASNTIGESNTAVGTSSLNNQTSGYYNSALGRSSLYSNTTGNYNSACGGYSMYKNTSGSNNTAMGLNALQENQIGNNNVAIGSFAGSLSKGDGNIFLGYNAGYNEAGSNKLYIDNSSTSTPLIYGDFSSNALTINGSLRLNDGTQSSGHVLTSDASGNATWQQPQTFVTDTLAIIADADHDTKIQVEESGDEDKIRFDLAGTERFVMNGPRLSVLNSGNSVFIGEGAGANDDLTNNFNVFIGYNSGANNTTGVQNNSIGYGALSTQSSSAGANNAFGYKALFNHTTGNFNSAFGDQSMNKSTTGTNNTALGASALFNNQTGSENVAVGVNAGYFTTGSGNVFLGSFAGELETGSNKLYIDNSDTGSPLIYGEFDNDIVKMNGKVGIGTTSAPTQELDVNGNTTTNGLQVGTGTMFSNMQGGKVDVGSHSGSVKTVNVTFSSAFSAAPNVICTASCEPGQSFDDAFNVTTRNVTTTGFTMIINRVDGDAWGQALDVHWFAFK
ncbi:MAG: H-type lectin domain-containing protein [Chitinophagales bacterium]